MWWAAATSGPTSASGRGRSSASRSRTSTAPGRSTPRAIWSRRASSTLSPMWTAMPTRPSASCGRAAPRRWAASAASTESSSARLRRRAFSSTRASSSPRLSCCGMRWASKTPTPRPVPGRSAPWWTWRPASWSAAPSASASRWSWPPASPGRSCWPSPKWQRTMTGWSRSISGRTDGSPSPPWMRSLRSPPRPGRSSTCWS